MINFRPKLDLSAVNIEGNDFAVEGYSILAKPEQLRSPRIVRLGLVQNSIVLPTTASIEEQRNALHTRIAQIAHSAYLARVNVLGLQEAWRKSKNK